MIRSVIRDVCYFFYWLCTTIRGHFDYRLQIVVEGISVEDVNPFLSYL